VEVEGRNRWQRWGSTKKKKKKKKEKKKKKRGQEGENESESADRKKRKDKIIVSTACSRRKTRHAGLFSHGVV
jgi:hypothetical protein